ncbi:MAG: hypothetical protein NTV36_00055 [Candidatus Staskawiczbacteria bacterium]|nr:hypothetical protein [Candidatus Staskawiczbacteria bacterium]
MVLELSSLKEIDFTRPDNLLFLVIVFVLVAFICLAILFVLAALIKAVKKLVFNIFDIDSRKPKLNQASNADWVRARVQENNNPVGVPKYKVAGGELVQNFKVKEEKVSEKNVKQSYSQKESKDIAEGLAGLKTADAGEEQSISSKMPSREADKKEDEHAQIQIPKARHFEKSLPVEKFNLNTNANTIEGVVNSKVQNFEQKKTFEAQEKSVENKTDSGVISPKIPFSESFSDTIHDLPDHLAPQKAPEELSFFEKPDFVENKVQKTTQDKSIFGGNSEVSRIKLEYKMKKDPNIWKAARDVKLNISPVERSKLVKEVFSTAFGRNISKSDLNWGLKKLNQKLIDARDKPTEHEKIRKEIKFFKKIGGIK